MRGGEKERGRKRETDIFERINNVAMEDGKSEICRTGKQAGKIRQELMLQL